MYLDQPCPLCQSNEVMKLQEPASPVYFICRICALIFIHDNFIPTPEKEKQRYDLHQNSLEDAGYVQMFERFLDDFVTPFVHSGVTALDFGSGPVPVLQFLMERREYHTDIYDPYYAPEKVYEGKKYGLITCTETLEHIRNPIETFNLFSSLLSSGGKLAIMTLFHPGIEAFPQWWYRRDPTHIRFYSKETFHWIERHIPFRIVKMNDKNGVTMERLP